MMGNEKGLYCVCIFLLENAEGNRKIPARYQDKYQNGAYDFVLVFCDTDQKPYEQYADINEFHGVENVADRIMMFGNPCTMQIINEAEHSERVLMPTTENF